MEEKQPKNEKEKINFYWSVKLDLYLLYKFFPDLTPSEAILMYYLIDFCNAKSNRIRKIVKDGIEYTWITYNHIIEQVPILQIHSKEGIRKLINKIFQKGIFTYLKENGRLYIAPTEKADMLRFVPIKKSVNYSGQGVNSSGHHRQLQMTPPSTPVDSIYNNNQYNYNQYNNNQDNIEENFSNSFSLKGKEHSLTKKQPITEVKTEKESSVPLKENTNNKVICWVCQQLKEKKDCFKSTPTNFICKDCLFKKRNLIINKKPKKEKTLTKEEKLYKIENIPVFSGEEQSEIVLEVAKEERKEKRKSEKKEKNKEKEKEEKLDIWNIPF